jgi:hypothetical protein
MMGRHVASIVDLLGIDTEKGLPVSNLSLQRLMKSFPRRRQRRSGTVS